MTPSLLRLLLTSAAFLLATLGTAATGQAADAVGTRTAPSIHLERGPIPVAQAFALKTTLGEAAFAAEVDAAVDQLWDRAEHTVHCATAAETAAAGEFELVRRSRDKEAAAASQAAGEAALAQRKQLQTLYLGGGPVAAPYGLIRRMVAHAKAETNPRLAELYRRVAQDQFSHIDSISVRPFLGPGIHTSWEKGLDEAALAYVDVMVSSEWCPMSLANAAWLRAELRDHDWYRISTYGADADFAAWLIVQHARQDLAFQREVLAMLEPLWAAGETRGEHFAMLYDQTAQHDGRPGRFGVLGKCTAPGVWTPAPLEDQAATDAWRAKAGMPPLAEQIATRSRGCAD